MPAFGKTSLERLATCDERLQRVFNEVIKVIDCKVTCGHRGEAEQNACFANKTSMLKYPKSRHNSLPSKAVDVVPYPSMWADEAKFFELAKVVKQVAADLGISIVWGGDWKKFKDLPHWEVGE